MSSTTPSRGFLGRILFALLAPIARPLAEMQERLARVEQRVNPLDEQLKNLTHWAGDEIQRHEDVMRKLDQIRGELNANAQLVTESSVYVERVAREVLGRNAAGPTPPNETARPAGRASGA